MFGSTILTRPKSTSGTTVLGTSAQTTNYASPSGSSAGSNWGDLTDPTTWMGLVNDRARLTQWVTEQAPQMFGANTPLRDYYVDKIVGQPGANETEQRGSAAYWVNEKIKADPNYASFDGAGGMMPGRTNINNKPVVGTAIPRGSEASNAFASAQSAANRVRAKAVGMGRASTILGGFNLGTPLTTPATILGSAHR